MKAQRIAFSIELLALIAGLAMFVLWWMYPNRANWEPIVGLFLCVPMVMEMYRRNYRSLTEPRFENAGHVVRHREGLRKLVTDEIYRCRAQKLRKDVIVHDVDRVDAYPDLGEKEEGMSSWFRVGLVDTYERGVVLGLRFGGLKECEGGYRFVDSVNGEESDLTVCLMGNIPYDAIVAINFDGDNYYNFPHIYCHYDFDNEPYERKWFAEVAETQDGYEHYKLVAEYEDVARNNPEDTLWF